MSNNMTPPQRGAILLGLLQLTTEYVEDMMNDGFGRVFTGTLKNDAKKLIKHYDNTISRICDDGDEELRQQMVDVYSYLTDVIDGIDWTPENKIEVLKKDKE